jgi:predicted nucleic acid-binding protein
MARVLVDANVLIAARLTRDEDHDRGKAITDAFDDGSLPVACVLSDVLEEVVNYLQARSGHETAVETLDAIVESRGFDPHFTPKRDFSGGRSLFRKYDQLSLTDAVIVAAMERLDIEYLYSFDDGFDAVEGVTRLTTPDDSFA